MGAVSIVRDCDHKNRLFKKYQTRDGLLALYEEWLPYKEPDDPYMQHLQLRIKKVETQLRNMRP